MKLLHSEEHVEKLRSTSKMSEDELKEMSQQYDYIYFHPVSGTSLLWRHSSIAIKVNNTFNILSGKLTLVMLNIFM